MDRYIGDIISDQRLDTRNDDTSAISNSDFVRFNQQAQDRLYGLISLAYSYAFEYTADINIAANTDAYTVDDNVAFGMRINAVYYSPDGTTSSLRRLRPTPNRPDVLRQGTRPRFYRRRRNQIVLEPIPTQAIGSIRVHYERALDRLALRVARVNGTPSGATITVDNEDSDLTGNLTADEYICICDAYGTPMLYNGIISDFSSPTLTLTADVEDYLETGYTLADLDNGYITVGKYTTTHSSLPNEAEGFFIEWVNRKLHNLDSSEQFDETDRLLAEIRDTIVASYELPDKDVKSFPISDFDLLILEYD